MMNFDLSPDVVGMADAIADFARAKLGPSCADDLEDFRRRWRLAGEHGLTGTVVPTEHGGGGLDAVTATALSEALGRGSPDLGFVFSLAAHVYACLTPIVRFGTRAQCGHWLPGLASGEQIAAHAITEPDSGSDIISLRTRAQRVAGGYVLRGNKCFITNAPVADVLLIQAVTDPDAGYFGLTTFVVPVDRDGIEISQPHQKVALTGSPTADVFLDAVWAHPHERLGPEGAGASVFSAAMAWERTCLFATYLGAIRHVLDDTIGYVRAREQFGAPIGSYQAVSHRVVDMLLRYESARLLVYRAAGGLDSGADNEIAPALAKIAVSEAALQVGIDAVQIRGALGIVEGPAERLVRDALASRIFSGTNEIQRNNVARALRLGSRITNG